MSEFVETLEAARPRRPHGPKAPKSREQLEAQVRLSLPDLLQWMGWHRRTWDKSLKFTFPAPRFIHNGHKFWATSQVIEWEDNHQPVRKQASR